MKKKNPDKTVKKSRINKRHTVDDLLKIMAKLRSPSGCPWDREQNEQTLKKYLIEESYEALEAIEAGNPKELKEELGDLLLQIIFLSRIAEEKGEFTFLDVVQGLAEKLIRRHPHVFPTPDYPVVHPQSAREVVKVWGAVKEREGKYAKRNSLLDGIPLALPALERARRISDRVSRVGFDWPDSKEVWKKVREELGELKKAERILSRSGRGRTRRPPLYPGELGPVQGNFYRRSASQNQSALCSEVFSGRAGFASKGPPAGRFQSGRNG